MSLGELKTWLREAIPVMIFSRMVCSRAVKVCSIISPAFSRSSLDKGHPIYVGLRPGHVFNVAVTDQGLYKVDISDIQFRLPPVDKDDEGSRSEMKTISKVLKDVSRNPYSAVKIEKFHGSIDDLVEPDGEVFDYDEAKQWADEAAAGKAGYVFPEYEDIFMTSANDSILNFEGERP